VEAEAPRPEGPAVRKLIDAYGAGGFRVGGARVEGAVLVSAAGLWPWPVSALGDATIETMRALLDDGGPIEILLLGCGSGMAPPPATLRGALLARGIRLEPMATGAACRTFNVMAAERRPVAAALLAV
jgi:uncharacterized protein